MIISTSSKRSLFSKQAANAISEAEALLKRIAETDNPAPLVRELTPQDLLVTWRAADDEQRIDLLQLADKEQVALLIDLTCWPTYQPDIDALDALLRPLVMSGAGGVQRALDTLEGELVTLLLKRNVKIHVLENRNDDLVVPDTSELVCCPDGFYYIEFPEPDLVTDVERALYAGLLMRPFEYYQKELESVRHELCSELEETALRWRAGRLSDFGFATRDEAIQLLTPRSPEEARRLAVASTLPKILLEGIRLPALVRDNLNGNEFLDAVFKALLASQGDQGAERGEALAAELGVMTNRFISATDVDVSDVDAVAQTATWARDLLGLGLFETAGGDIEEGARLLSALHPGMLLQVGLHLIYPLKDRARALLADERLIPKGRQGSVLDPPYRTALFCLSRDIPCRWPSLDAENVTDLDVIAPSPAELSTFSHPSEVAKAESWLDEINWLPALLFDGLKCKAPLLRGTPASVFVLTALAGAIAGREPTAKSVLRDEAVAFAENVLGTTEEELIKDALRVLAPLVDTDPEPLPAHRADPLPARRLLVRLIRLGRSRLSSDVPERVLLIENI